MEKYRWIVYLYTPMPGDVGTTFRRVTSLTGALLALANFELHSGFADGCTASLYPYTEDGWADANEFATVGNPFDYPSKVIDRGPRGGMRIVDA